MLENYLDAEVQIEKSPSVEGIIQGSKAALLVAPIGAAVQALRGRSPTKGAIVTGFGAGMLAGLTAAAVQKFQNMKIESEMKYHMQNVMERNPTMFQPPPFAQGFENVRHSY